jgi:hypothetical protein
MATQALGSSSSSSSSSLSSMNRSSKYTYAHRRFSAPHVENPSSSASITQVAKEKIKPLFSLPLPPLPASKKNTTSCPQNPPHHPQVIHYSFSDSRTITRLTPPTHSLNSSLLAAPLTRNRSHSDPSCVILHEISDEESVTVLTSGSSSSSVARMVRESKENKETEKRFSRVKVLTSHQKLQWADQLMAAKEPKGYLQQAITLVREVVQSEESSKTPCVTPYLKLVDLLSKTKKPVENTDIIVILDHMIDGHFSVWERVDALLKKALVFKTIHEASQMATAIACWQRAKLLMQDQTSLEDEMRKLAYTAHCNKEIRKMKKQQTTIETWTTTS